MLWEWLPTHPILEQSKDLDDEVRNALALHKLLINSLAKALNVRSMNQEFTDSDQPSC